MSGPGLERAISRFEQRFGRMPTVAVSAPGRVNLIGEHTDYNDGFVLPMAIDRRCWLVADHGRDDSVVVDSLVAGGEFRFRLGQEREAGTVSEEGWGRYLRGVCALAGDLDLNPGPWVGVIDSSIPLGGGLSSSAALTVAIATGLESLAGRVLDPMRKILLCRDVEHRFAGVPCGIMDPFVAVRATRSHALMIDCRSRTFSRISVGEEVAIVVIDTGVHHDLAAGAYADRRRSCERAALELGVGTLRELDSEVLAEARDRLDAETFRRLRHVVGENRRTTVAAEALTSADWPRFGELMYESHASLRDDYEVSVPELDRLVEAAREIGPAGGVHGARMTGGGFGGCAILLVDARRGEELGREITTACASRGCPPNRFFATGAAAGVSVHPIPVGNG